MNDANAKRCWYCQADLTRQDAPAKNDSQDWLNNLRDNSPAPQGDDQPEEPANSSESPNEEVPAWLARIRTREQSERAASEDALSASSEELSSEIPDWLNEFNPDQEKEKPDAILPASASAQPENEDDDWLKKLESWQSEPTSSPEKTSTDVTVGSREKPAEKNPIEDEAVTPPDSALIKDSAPEWLQAFVQEPKSTPAAQQGNLSVQQPSTSAFLPAERTPKNEEDSLLRDSEPGQISPTAESIESSELDTALAPSQPGEENETWLSSYKKIHPDKDIKEQVIPAPVDQDQTKAPFNENSLMDWMKPIDPVTNPSQKEPVPQLEPAALPAWLQALSLKHNGKASAPSHSSSDFSDFGPLAGIEGTLPGEELNQFYKRPQTFSGLLKTTESQQVRSKLLKNIADQTHWEDENLEEKPHSHIWIFRLIVTVLMLAAVFIPLLFTQISSIAPSLYPDEVVQTFNTVNALSGGKPVLIAADFDGSLFGELNWSYQPLLAHLMERNIPIAFLSTNSEGTTLLNQSASTLIKQYPAYASSDKWMNLGYLAGGSIGLQGLAQNIQTTMPLNSALQSAWLSKPFDTVKRISDFGALIVITENADTGKYWIEQVKPSLGTTPMLVVISAQSAPLLQPYYASGQISGYLSGLNSAVAYEALTKTPQNATAHLSSFQITMVLAIMLVLIGGIVSLIFYHPQPGKKKRVNS